MKFAYSSNAYTRYTLEEAIQHVSDLGYTGIELLADEPHLPGTVLDPDERDRIRSALDEANIAISNINCNTSVLYGTNETDPEFGPTFMETDSSLREQRIQHVLHTIENADLLNAPCICISSGEQPNDLSDEKADQLIKNALNRILDKADQHDVKMGIEFEPGHLFGSVATTADWIERMGSPLLGFNFDVGHAWVTRETPWDMIHQHAQRIWNVHIEDIPGRTHEHIIPGNGDLPLDNVLNALKENGYTGFCTVELYPYEDRPDEAGKKALDYLESLLHS